MCLCTLVLTAWLCVASIGEHVQKHVAFTPLQTEIDTAFLEQDTGSSVTCNNDDQCYWYLSKQSLPQSGYDLLLSLDGNEWGFPSDIVSALSLTVTGTAIPSLDNDMRLFVVLSVNDTQYWSIAVNLDGNGAKYATYPSLRTPTTNKKVSEWMNDLSDYALRRERISNHSKWLDTAPAYNAQAIWPITFEFVNSPIRHSVEYKFYHHGHSNPAQPVVTQSLDALFLANSDVDIYIMTDEPRADLFISMLNVSITYHNDIEIFVTPRSMTTSTSVASVDEQNGTDMSTTLDMKVAVSTSRFFSWGSIEFLYLIIAVGSSILSFVIGLFIGSICCSSHHTKQYRLASKSSISQINKSDYQHQRIPQHPPPDGMQNDEEQKYETYPFAPPITRLSIHRENERKTEESSQSDTREDNTLIPRNGNDGNNAQNIVVYESDNEEQNAVEIRYADEAKRENGDEEEHDLVLTINRRETVTRYQIDFSETSDSSEEMYKSPVQDTITPMTRDRGHTCHSSVGLDTSVNCNAPMGVHRDEAMIKHEPQPSMDSVELKQWLELQVGLPQYFENFDSFGYESLRFVKEISRKAELEEIGINRKGHQTKLMAEIERLSISEQDQPEGRPRR
mmetsp:Transcript_15529/g.24505  ORF Transcript_15529/g.24505 Transcript_15529/m.24505 type:complete len:619 (-) Transcript_15529:88-1944(-)